MNQLLQLLHVSSQRDGVTEKAFIAFPNTRVGDIDDWLKVRQGTIRRFVDVATEESAREKGRGSADRSGFAASDLHWTLCFSTVMFPILLLVPNETHTCRHPV
jgi:hypothetical protein